MGRVDGRGPVLVIVAAVAIVGQIAVCAGYGGPPQYALNYGGELSELEKQIPVHSGLAWGYYAHSCSHAESIIAQRVATFLRRDAGVAAGALRLFFHDCFVQGCDGSILLKLPSGTELDDNPNQTIRASALQLVDDIKARLENACPRTVSCADIVVMAAKVAVQQSGGPAFNVPLGRKDSLSFSASTSDLPSPRTSFAQQSSIFNSKGLDNTDLVALAGAHTLGIAHCFAFNYRLLPTVDPQMNSDYASYLKTNVCPTLSSSNNTGLDFYSPNTFDNQYFKNLPTGGALLESDQNLNQDSTAWGLVNKWAGDQADFFNQFLWSFVKMSQIQPLTGRSGEVRRVCSRTNRRNRVNDSAAVDDKEANIEPETSVSETVELVQTVDSSSIEEPEPQLISMVVDGRGDI